MIIKPRKTAQRMLAQRITAPEFRENRKTGAVTLLLSFANVRSDQCHYPTTKELFLYAAGSAEEGEAPDGLDILLKHQFNVHLNNNDNDKARAIGIDIIPKNVLAHKMVALSQVENKTVVVEWLLDGAVCRITKTPPNTTASLLQKLVLDLDALINAETEFAAGTKIGSSGTVVSVGVNTMEVRIKPGAKAASVSSQAVDAQAIASESD